MGEFSHGESNPDRAQAGASNLTIWVVRIAALAIVLLLLWWNTRGLNVLGAQPPDRLGIAWSRFWRIQAVNVLAGFVFSVGVRFPFPRPRFAWSLLVVAGIVLLPVVHAWYALTATSGPELLFRFHWFNSVPIPIWSMLAGVAIGAGVGARRASEEPPSSINP